LTLGDSNAAEDVFVRDRVTNLTILVSTSGIGGGAASGPSDWPSISGDGTAIAFRSAANDLVAGDTNGSLDVFLYNLFTGTNARVSTGAANVQANGDSGVPALDRTATFVAFETVATNLGAPPATSQVVRKATGGTAAPVLVSVSNFGFTGSGQSTFPAISADGNRIAFLHYGSDLIGTGFTQHVYVRDVAAGTTAYASADDAGAPGDFGASARPPSISSDGLHVAFASESTNLVSNDGNGKRDVFVRSFDGTGRTYRVSLTGEGSESAGLADWPAIAGNGAYVVYQSDGSDVVAGDTNLVQDLFRARRERTYVGYCYGTSSVCPCGNGGAYGYGCENSHATGGGLLTATGAPSLSADSIVLTATGLPPGTTVEFLQGTSQTSVVFGDGLRCAGGAVIRFPLRVADQFGTCSFGTGIGSDPAVSVVGFVASPATRFYQAWYRNSAPYCTTSNFNLSNGIAIEWHP
jgi:hypothetical protein